MPTIETIEIPEVYTSGLNEWQLLTITRGHLIGYLPIFCASGKRAQRIGGFAAEFAEVCRRLKLFDVKAEVVTLPPEEGGGTGRVWTRRGRRVRLVIK